MSAPELLALVIHDPLAPSVLAWWQAVKPELEQSEPYLAETYLHDALVMVRAPSLAELKKTIARCKLAGLLTDGAISDTAQRWLCTFVGQQLSSKPKKPKR